MHMRDLCRSQLFYYSAGISFGLLASLLILVYMMSKVMPKVSVKLSGVRDLVAVALSTLIWVFW